MLLVFLLVAAFSGTAFATAPTVIINSPSLGYFRGTGLVIDFNWSDTNEAHNRVDVNISLSNVPNDGLADANILYDLNVLDNNILGNVVNLAGVSVNGGCLNADSNSATSNRCTFTFNTATIADGNYFVDINMASDDLPTPLVGTKRSASSVSIDNTAPATTAAALSGAIGSWTSTTPVTITLTCADANSGCSTTTYKLDANAMRGVSLGAVTTYAGAISIAPDGNFVLDFNSTDRAGNIEAVSRATVLIDSNVPVIGTDFLFDVNRTGIVGGTVSTDRFIGKDQNLGFSLKWLADVNGNLGGKETSPFTDVNFIASQDLNSLDNRQFVGQRMTTGDLNWTADYNVGTFDLNFSPKFASVRIKDQAGNSRDNNALTQVILYSMQYPGGAGLDQNSDTTDFQTIANFVAIANAQFTKSGFGRLRFLENIDLSTQVKAAQLASLGASLKVTRITGSTGNDLNISLDSQVLSDFNKSAQLTLFHLPYSSMPGILINNDQNCSTICTAMTYNAALGQLDVNVTHFSDFISDGNAPGRTAAAFNPTPPLRQNSITISTTTDETARCRVSSQDVNYGAMGPGTTTSNGTSHSFTLTYDGNNLVRGNNTFYIRCEDLVANRNTTSIAATFELNLASSSGRSGRGEGSGAASAFSEGSETNYVPYVPAHEERIVAFANPDRHGVTAIIIRSGESMSAGTLTVDGLSNSGAAPALGQGLAVVGYLNVSHDLLADRISKTLIQFRVSRGSLAAQGLTAENVALYRYANETWSALPTKVTSSDADFVYFEAESPGFSVFAIAGKATEEPQAPSTTGQPSTEQPLPGAEKRGKTTAQLPSSRGTTPSDATAVQPAAETPAQPTSTTAKGIDWVVVAVVVGLGLAAAYYFFGRKGGQAPLTYNE